MPPEINLHRTYQFEWDETKNRTNIQKHGFDFIDAETMFGGIFLFHSDLRKDYGERRCTGIGTIRGRTAVLVFTFRGRDTIRVISLRKVNREEREQYEKALKNRLEAD